MKEITLTHGKVALVDDEDFDFLNQFKWFAKESNNTYYAQRGVWNGENMTPQRMHRIIMKDIPDGMFVDHIDGNGLNNQKSNLRIATKSQNAQNMCVRSDNVSGCTGVSWQDATLRWQVSIQVNGKRIFLGCFSDLQDAIEARRNAEKKHHPYSNPLRHGN
jgi:hypothetical protein